MLHWYVGYDQAGIGADGFQEIFTATMAASLEWGLHKYAKAVLENCEILCLLNCYNRIVASLDVVI